MDWGGETLNTHRPVAQFLDDFWSGSTSHNEALEFGQSLLRRLLEPKPLADSWNHARQRLGPGRLRLELVLPTDNPDLWEVPFELLADEHGFLCYEGRAALIRCFPKLDAEPAELQHGHRLLIAWANPKGLQPPVDDKHFEAYARLFSEQARNGGFEVPEPLAQAGPNELRTKLQAGAEVFSLMAHGQPGGGRLLLEAEDRSAVELEVGSLAADLTTAQAKVALLWMCHSGRAHRDLGSFAKRLLHRSLAAVVATHGALRADWVAAASTRLIESLVEQGDFEQAVNGARRALEESNVHWAALAYYARPRFERTVTFAQAAALAMEKLSRARAERPLGEDAPPRPFYWIDSSRERELAEILNLLQSHRLVTLLGMPGIGKTELAREAGERIAHSPSDYYVNSVHWFALDELGTTARLLARLARWANLQDTTVDESKLLMFIGGRRALWVLDNAEDLLREPQEASALAALLSKVTDKCPGIRLLFTSQRSVPAASKTASVVEYLVQRIESEPACFELFRATCASPLAEEHEPKARALVEILYGHPSSIVLVSGQVRERGAEIGKLQQRLFEELNKRELLDQLGAAGDQPPDERERKRRLVACLNLAHQPLVERQPAAAELFAWLCMLPAGLDPPMAVAIFGPDTPYLIADLRESALVAPRQDRLELTPPVRWYAEHKLETAVPRQRQLELLERTLGALQAFMAACYEQIDKPGAGAVLAASLREEANLAALVQRFERLRAATPERSSLLARAVTRWSRVRLHGGTLNEATALAARALELAAGGDRGDVAALQEKLGDLFLRTQRLAEADAAFQAALDIYLAIDHRLGAANTQQARGDLFLRTDRLAEADVAYQAALDAYLAIDERLGAANTQKARGDLFLRTHRLAEADAAYQAALNLYLAIDARLGAANTYLARGDLFLRTARLAEAEAAYQAALDAYVAIDHRLGAANTRSSLGLLALAHGDAQEAFTRLRQARAELLQLDERLGAAGQLGYLAQAALASGQPARALLLAGRAWQELAALDDRWGRMLAASIVLEAARHASDEAGVPAAIFTWHMARRLQPAYAERLTPLVEQVLPPEILASGLPPEALAQLEQHLHQLFEARWQQALAAGDDPLAPLPPPTDAPPDASPDPSPEAPP